MQVAVGEHGLALALGRVLEALGESVPGLDDWERLNVAVHEQAVATGTALALHLADMPGVPDVLLKGTDPLAAAPAWQLV